MNLDMTGLVVFIAILALAIYDLAVVVFRGTGSSISQFLIKTAFKSPLVSFGFGAAAGHLFFLMYDTNCTLDWPERILVAACGAVIAWVGTVVYYDWKRPT